MDLQVCGETLRSGLKSVLSNLLKWAKQCEGFKFFGFETHSQLCLFLMNMFCFNGKNSAFVLNCSQKKWDQTQFCLFSTQDSPLSFLFVNNNIYKCNKISQDKIGAVVVVRQLDLQQPMQKVPITTNVVGSNTAHAQVYSTQYYVIKFVSDLRHVCGFLRVLRIPPPIKLTATV